MHRLPSWRRGLRGGDMAAMHANHSSVGRTCVKEAVGLLVQTCGWLFVLVSLLFLLLGLVLVLAPPREILVDDAYMTLIVGLFLAPMLLVPLSIGLVQGGGLVRRSRARHGVCARCGYDLRGGGARCPECGAEI